MEQVHLNTFSGQASGTTFNIGNSGSGGNPFEALTWAGGTAQFNNAPPWGGSDNALRITLGSAGQIYVRWDLYATGNRRVVARRPLYVQTLPLAGGGYVMSMYSETGRKAALAIESVGRLLLVNAGGAFIASTRSSTQLAQNTLYWLEFAVTSGTTTSNGRAEYAIYAADGVTQLETFDTGATFDTTIDTDVTRARIGGMHAGDTGWTYEWLDNIKAAVLDTGWLGPSMDILTVNAEADQSNVEPYSTVNLSATASDTVSTWLWTQTAGPTVTIQNATSQNASFIAPTAFSASTLTFRVTANGGEAVSDVSVAVLSHMDWFADSSGVWLPARRQSID